jgi:hypothetical protein
VQIMWKNRDKICPTAVSSITWTGRVLNLGPLVPCGMCYSILERERFYRAAVALYLHV